MCSALKNTECKQNKNRRIHKALCSLMAYNETNNIENYILCIYSNIVCPLYMYIQIEFI